MPRTVPGRRVVVAEQILKDTVETVNAEDFDRPEPATRPSVGERRRLSYKERLERRLEMADMALEKYEDRLSKGEHLEPEEERLFLAHQDSIRKLESTLFQLEAKDKGGDNKTEVELALDLIDAGWTFDDAVRAFQHNPKLPSKLREALDERE